MKSPRLGILCLAVVAALSSTAHAAPPIAVSYTVTGTSGDWNLDFTFANNITGASNQGLYFLGVLTDSDNVTNSLSQFSSAPYTGAGWNNSPYGGSDNTYNDVWIDNDYTYTPGSVLLGFDVNLTDAVAPTSVDWFAITYDPSGSTPYTGGGNFNSEQNPGFEGIATQGSSSVPDAGSSLALFGMGLSAVAMLRRKLGKA